VTARKEPPSKRGPGRPRAEPTVVKSVRLTKKAYADMQRICELEGCSEQEFLRIAVGAAIDDVTGRDDHAPELPTDDSAGLNGDVMVVASGRGSAGGKGL